MEFRLKELKQEFSITQIANVHFFEFERSFSTRNDTHPFHELIFVSSGAMQVSSDGYKGILHKGEMIIHKPNELHSLTCPSNSSPTVIIIGFVCRSNLLERFSAEPVKLNDEAVKELAEIVKEGRKVFAPPFNAPTYDMKKKKNIPFGSEHMLKILLEYFLIARIREYSLHVHQESVEKQPFLFTMNELIKYVDDNFLEKISIDELAFLFHTNRATLCKEFKNMTGYTLLEYVNKKKIALAKERLSRKDKTVTEVALELNFETIHYFTRFFKKQTGITPTAYQKSLAK